MALLTVLSLFAAPVLTHGGVFRPPPPSSRPGPIPRSAPRPGKPAEAPPLPNPPPRDPRQPGAPSNSPAAPGPSSPGTPGGTGVLDEYSWRHWWARSSDRWIDLKGHVHALEVVTGADDFYLGRGTREADSRDLRPSAAELDGRIVPALVQELEAKHSDRVTAALIGLAKIGPRKIAPESWVPLFERHLRDPNQEVVETSVLALGLSGEPAGESTLLDLMLDRSRGRTLLGGKQVPERTRAFAAYGLGLLGRGSQSAAQRYRIVQQLIGAVEDERSATRDLVVAAVSAIGLVPLGDSPHLPRPDSGRPPGEHAVKALSLRTQLEWLANIALEPNPRRASGQHWIVRAHAATALARLGTAAPDPVRATLVPQLVRTLRRRGEQESVQQSVALALGWLVDSDEDEHDVEAREALVHALAKGQPRVRRFALIALARIGARAGSGESPRAGLRDCRDVLLDTFSRGKSQLRPWAGLALGVLGRELIGEGMTPDEDVTHALRLALASRSAPDSVGAYALALGLRRDVGGVAALEDKLARTEDSRAQGELALAMGLIGERGPAEDLRERLIEARYRPLLLYRLAVALALLHDRGASDDLIAILGSSKSDATRAAVAAALGAAGDRRSLEPLLALLEDEQATDGARAFAAVALGGVGDRHRLPWSQPYSEDVNYFAAPPTMAGTGTGILDIL
jgi:HEAT repeat protein